MNLFKKLIAGKAGKVAAAAVGAGILYSVGVINETGIVEIVSTIGA